MTGFLTSQILVRYTSKLYALITGENGDIRQQYTNNKLLGNRNDR